MKVVKFSQLKVGEQFVSGQDEFIFLFRKIKEQLQADKVVNAVKIGQGPDYYTYFQDNDKVELI